MKNNTATTGLDPEQLAAVYPRIIAISTLAEQGRNQFLRTAENARKTAKKFTSEMNEAFGLNFRFEEKQIESPTEDDVS